MYKNVVFSHNHIYLVNISQSIVVNSHISRHTLTWYIIKNDILLKKQGKEMYYVTHKCIVLLLLQTCYYLWINR